MEVLIPKKRRNPTSSKRQTPMRTNSTAIWTRITNLDGAELSPAFARYLCKLDFTEADHQRIQELNVKANEGALTTAEVEELEEYIRSSELLTILQSKARRSLRKHGSRT